MMRSTTQKGIQTAFRQLPSTFRVDHLDLHTARLAGKWYVDWISSGTKLLVHNAGAFVFSDRNSTEVYPSESKQQMPAKYEFE